MGYNVYFIFLFPTHILFLCTTKNKYFYSLPSPSYNISISVVIYLPSFYVTDLLSHESCNFPCEQLLHLLATGVVCCFLAHHAFSEMTLARSDEVCPFVALWLAGLFFEEDNLSLNSIQKSYRNPHTNYVHSIQLTINYVLKICLYATTVLVYWLF